MAQIIISSDDAASEGTFDAYRQTRNGIQSLAGQMYQAIDRCDVAYAEFDALLESGQYVALADYHKVLQAPVDDAVLMLRQQMAGVLALMRQMESAMPPGTILFPGVPKNEG